MALYAHFALLKTSINIETNHANFIKFLFLLADGNFILTFGSQSNQLQDTPTNARTPNTATTQLTKLLCHDH